MSFFEWTPALDVHVEAMNDDHRVLIALMNKLHDESNRGASFEALNSIIDELAKFTVEHFTREERVLEEIQYPGLKQHRQVHKNLLERFNYQWSEYRQVQGPVPERFFTFLKQWLSAHIMGIDADYGKHAQKRVS